MSSTVRVARFEISGFGGNPSEVKARWMHASERIKEATNFIWRQWEAWHTANDSSALLRAWLNKLKEWHRAQEHNKKSKKPKPKIPVQAIPKQLDKLIYDRLHNSFPDVHGRSLELLRQVIKRDIIHHKASTGNLSGWIALLLDRQDRPSTEKLAKIRFDKSNSSLLVPETRDEPCTLSVRTDRTCNDKGGAASTCDVVTLITKPYKARSQRAILEGVRDGKYKLHGSMIGYDRKNRKWFAFICWSRVKPTGIARELHGTALLSARRKYSFVLTLPDGRRIRLRQGDDRYHPVIGVRRRLLTQRWCRKATYRFAGSSNKGHGRKRAMQHIDRLSNRWKDFVRTFNHNISRFVRDVLVEHGVARLVYLQPTGGYAAQRFLSTAGKIPGRHDSSSWDWSQLASQLSYKLNNGEVGIHCEVRKVGSARERPNSSTGKVA